MLDGERRAAADDGGEAEALRGDGARLDATGLDVEGFVGDGDLGGRRRSRRWSRRDRRRAAAAARGTSRRASAASAIGTRLVGRLAEAHDVEEHRRRWRSARSPELLDEQRVDPPEQPRHRQRQHLGGPARLDAGPVERRLPCGAGGLEWSTTRRPCSSDRSAPVSAVETTFLPDASSRQMSSSAPSDSSRPAACTGRSRRRGRGSRRGPSSRSRRSRRCRRARRRRGPPCPRCRPRADELELGMAMDGGDGGAAGVAGGPLGCSGIALPGTLSGTPPGSQAGGQAAHLLDGGGRRRIPAMFVAGWPDLQSSSRSSPWPSSSWAGGLTSARRTSNSTGGSGRRTRRIASRTRRLAGDR